MDKTAEKIINYATDLTYADLTPSAVQAVKRSVLDSIGCAYGTFNDQPMKALRSLASKTTSTPPATVIGTQIKSSVELAGFAGASGIRYADFSDDYFGGTGDMGPHPSDNIAGILAAAESVGADGKTLVTGIAIAYEIVGQLCDVIKLGGVKPTWDYPFFHSMATSMGTGKVMGLTREEMREALSLAIIPNIALSQTRLGELANWKGLRGPNGSRQGIFAVLMAKEGITAPVDPIEGKAGLMNHINQHFEFGAMGGKGVPFKIEGTYFKCLPVRYNAQLAIWIGIDLRKQVKLDDIKEICIYREKRSMIAGAENPEYWNPTTRETADHSLPYVVGAAMVDGEITPKTFTPERFRDPTILNFIKKIHMQGDQEFSDAYPKTFHCRFEVTMKSGEVINIHKTNPKGHPANPVSEKDLEEKFLKQSEGLLPPPQARALLDELWQLEKLKDYKKLFTLMEVKGAK